MDIRRRWLVLLGLLGLGPLAWLVWAVGHTAPPPAPVLVADLVAVVGLLVGPWLVYVGQQLVRRIEAETQAVRTYARVLVIIAILGIGGPLAGVTIAEPLIDTPGVAAGIGVFPVLVAALIAIVGAVFLPWVHLLTRSIVRERAARVRAEGRAEMAAHLHDTVLQALTLIQKRTDDPAAVQRLARGTERELRAWLYGAPPAGGDDFAAAVTAVAQETEDRFDVTVELGVVGTGPLDPPARAVVGALREALTNAARHAGVRSISVYAEVVDGTAFAIVRDRGRGFDPTVHSGRDRRGIAYSIEDRMRRHGGVATVRSTPGAGTEIELRMPLGVPV